MRRRSISYDYAHLQGEGPVGKYCHECRFWKEESRARHVCTKISDLIPGAVPRKIESRPSCKYFQMPAPPATALPNVDLLVRSGSIGRV